MFFRIVKWAVIVVAAVVVLAVGAVAALFYRSMPDYEGAATLPGLTAEAHSTDVRLFFENLLPEGQALDDAACASGTSKSNLMGLMIALGKETAGAIRTTATSAQPAEPP